MFLQMDTGCSVVIVHPVCVYGVLHSTTAHTGRVFCVSESVFFRKIYSIKVQFYSDSTGGHDTYLLLNSILNQVMQWMMRSKSWMVLLLMDNQWRFRFLQAECAKDQGWETQNSATGMGDCDCMILYLWYICRHTSGFYNSWRPCWSIKFPYLCFLCI
jgi:hypothetical protein